MSNHAFEPIDDRMLIRYLENDLDAGTRQRVEQRLQVDATLQVRIHALERDVQFLQQATAGQPDRITNRHSIAARGSRIRFRRRLTWGLLATSALVVATASVLVYRPATRDEPQVGTAPESLDSVYLEEAVLALEREMAYVQTLQQEFLADEPWRQESESEAAQ